MRRSGGHGNAVPSAQTLKIGGHNDYVNDVNDVAYDPHHHSNDASRDSTSGIVVPMIMNDNDTSGVAAAVAEVVVAVAVVVIVVVVVVVE